MRIFLALAGFMACLQFGTSRAAAYDLADFDWCFNNMPKVYDRAFEVCVDANCKRISNKKVSQKRGCYQTCKGEAVDTCLSERAQGPTPKVVTPAATVAPVVPPNTAAPESIAAVPTSPAEAAAPETAERAGFFSRLFGGVGGGPKQPAAPQDAGTPNAASAQSPEDEGKREGFFTRIAKGFSEGITDGFDADYNWCRDQSGGHFQELLKDCTRGCLAGPSAGASKRQGCIQSCRSSSVRACIAKRDGK